MNYFLSPLFILHSSLRRISSQKQSEDSRTHA
jgi:hypothetical protein